MFVKDPARDFTRERKLPLREVISVLLCMEGGSLTGELLRYFGCSQHTASSSALYNSVRKSTNMPFLRYLTCLYEIQTRTACIKDTVYLQQMDRISRSQQILNMRTVTFRVPMVKHRIAFFTWMRFTICCNTPISMRLYVDDGIGTKKGFCAIWLTVRVLQRL